MSSQVSLEQEVSRDALVEPSLSQRVSRALQVAKHYSWLQMARRGVSLVKRKFSRRSYHLRKHASPVTITSAPDTWHRIFTLIANDLTKNPNHKFADLDSGTFRLLNREVELGQPVVWDRARQETHLWRFQLQYHEFLLRYLEPESDKKTCLSNFLEHWLDSFSTQVINTQSDAWHPYCISRRIPVWVWLLTYGEIPERLKERLTHSLIDQTIFLSTHLETDLGGNHLLENLYALKLASTVLPKGALPPRVEKAAQRFEKELAAQLLASGEHFERSPMYHCHILANLLVAIAAEEAFGSKENVTAREQACRMLSFLEQICHPDGEIPLFGDSGFGEALSTAGIRIVAAQLGIHPENSQVSTSPSDYWITKSGDDFLIVDHGEIAAANLPAHGHCDLLGFEGSIAGRRWFVDSGNFDYESGSMRAYCRSALAHNVVTLNRKNTAEVWSKFRMGNRPSVLSLKTGATENYRWMLAVHNSFRRTHIPRASRFFAASSLFWLCSDYVASTEKHVEGWLHLASGMEFQALNENEFSLHSGESVRYILFFGCRKVSWVDGCFCPSFGVRQSSHACCYEKDTGASYFGWVLTPAPLRAINRDESSVNFSFLSGEEFSVALEVA